MSDRRFTDKPDLNPYAVRGLALDHPAMVENRTLFPSTVIEVTESVPDRLLVSGVNNRKLGKTVEKGAFKGYALYGLSLEERATCPADCGVRDICYGNGMQMGRRHRIGDPDVFYDRLGFEILDLLGADDAVGLLVRLHVLGDFPSVEYVGFWADALRENPNLAVYGYTARRSAAWGGDEIGDAIQAVKDQHPDRFRIRWSGAVSRPDGATVIGHVPKQARIDEGIVCPSQTDASACCASCGLCWEPTARRDSIVFIKHGPKSGAVEAAHVMARSREEDPGGRKPLTREDDAQGRPTRRVLAVDLPKSCVPALVVPEPPVTRLVRPHDLLIEESYQRELSTKSLNLIRKIVSGWDWARFKPPVVAETADGLFVIDGQHTAIAAATHPKVVMIPVLIVQAAKMERRAASFVAHNRDRLVMSPLQIFHAEAAAGDPASRELLALAELSGAKIPRSPPAKGAAKAGQVVAVRQLRGMLTTGGSDVVERIFRIAVAAQQAPLTRTATVGLFAILTWPLFADVSKMVNSRIANALRSLGDLEAESKVYAAASGQSQERACAAMIAEACRRTDAS